MRTPRMTTRRWMCAVAILGLSLAVGMRVEKLVRLRALHVARSERAAHGELAAKAAQLRFLSGAVDGTYESKEALRTAKNWAEVVDYHGAMREKYRRAALLPWIPVAADPPSPIAQGVFSRRESKGLH